MNTHIIISIKEIEDRIKDYQYKFDNNEDLEAKKFYKSQIHLLKQILKGKQISLDEKDIEEKANKQIFTGLNTPQNAYKQALKDLL